MAKTLKPVTATRANPFPAGAHPLDWRKSGLPAFARRICRSVAEAILCDENERGELVPPDDRTLDAAVHKLDLWLGTGSAQLATGFLALCVGIETMPLLVIRSPRRMTKLPLRQRIHYLEKLEESENGMLSMLLVAFKVPLATVAFEEGELLHSTGFDRDDLIVRRKLDLVPTAPHDATSNSQGAS